MNSPSDQFHLWQVLQNQLLPDFSCEIWCRVTLYFGGLCSAHLVAFLPPIQHSTDVERNLSEFVELWSAHEAESRLGGFGRLGAVTEQRPESTRGDSQIARLNRANGLNEGLEARVADLRRWIVDGSYYVDPAKLSAKIVDHHRR
jgi:hypothetical protein